MGKYILNTLLAAFALSSSVEAETLISEDFENFAGGKNFEYIKIEPSDAAPIEGKRAISGNASLEIDTLGLTREYPPALKISHPQMTPNFLYKLSFKCRTPKFLPSQYRTYYVYMERKPASVRERDSAIGAKNGTTFSFKNGGKAKEFVFYFAPLGGSENPYIRITSSVGARIVVDDLRLEKLPLPKCAWMLEKDAFLFLRISPVAGAFYNETDPMFALPREKFFPFVDKYGQLKHKNWRGKIQSDGDFKVRIEEENAFEQKLGAVPNRDKYFGLLDPAYKFEPTGRFAVRKVGGKWFFVTPAGNLFWSHGIDCAGSIPTTPVSGRENYFDDVSDKKYRQKGWWSKGFYKDKKYESFCFGQRNIDIKYGDAAKDYPQVVARRMKSWGLNTYGAWSKPELFEGDVPFAFFASSKHPTILESKVELNAYWQPVPDYFDPKFEELTNVEMLRHAKALNSPYCVGVFVDNELPWQTQTILTPKAVLACPPSQPSKIEFAKFLESKYGTFEKINTAWGANYKNRDDFLARTDFFPKTEKSQRDMLAFERKIYERYFSVCRNAVKNVSPDVLYFGCRMAWTNELLEEVASEYCDVVSFNLYRDDVSAFKLPEEAKDKPVIIGEFHFGNQDAGVFGGGLRPCATMGERMEKYNTYVASAVENPIIVGAHWFQYFDQPVTGRSGDGENYSVGFVDIADTPIYEAAEAARKISERMYDMRLSGKRTVKIKKQKTVTY